MGKERDVATNRGTWRRYIKYMVVLAFTLQTIMLCRSCCHALSYDRQETYTSPLGTNTVIVRYNIVSTPTIYKKGRFRNEKIWDYPNNGFMETVWFELEWLSENEIRFSYDDKCDEYDEEFIITIPE